MTLFENFVISEVRAGKSIIGPYPATREETRRAFESWRSDPDRSSGSR